ncbi:MAG: hypothetical protein ACR2NP_09705 [Pirellulaceae bacterium]
MTASTMTLKYQRLRTPDEDGQSLQVPPLAEFPETLAANQQTLATHEFSLLGESIHGVREQARADLYKRAVAWTSQYRDVSADGPGDGFVLAGHQPTLFHPGVWYKNFSLHRLAQNCQLSGINLVIDNDLSALSSIRVPTGSVSNPQIKNIHFDDGSSLGPYEAEALSNPETFRSFGRRVYKAIQGFVDDPLVGRLWPYVIAAEAKLKNPAWAIAAGRHRLEQDFGLQTLEVPLSQLCASEPFAAFAGELVSRAPELREMHNRALLKYRQLHRIRSHSHPVPELAAVDGWIEVPFWIWRCEQPRRNRLFVHVDDQWILVSDLESIEIKLDRADLAGQLVQLERAGVCLRPRALTTTMYARLVLSDALVHGIGGAKYDQLTDQIIGEFFGAQPPQFNILTATHRLPLPVQLVDDHELTQLDVQLRQLTWHADKYGDLNTDQLRELANQKQQLLREVPAEDKKAWHDRVAEINQRLQPGVAGTRDLLTRQRAALVDQLAASRLLGSREFSFCLFDERLVEQLRVE